MRAIFERKIKRLIRYIFVGALSLLPLVLVLVTVNFFKDLGEDAYVSIHHYTNSFGLTITLLAIVFIIFVGLGYSIEHYGRSVVVSMIDGLFERIPAIRAVYIISKKMAKMLSGDKETGKKEVVLIEYPKEGMWAVAYVLNRHASICVLFVPTSPNPTSGYTIMIDESRVIKTPLSLQEASSFIISMGADFPQKEALVEALAQTKQP